MVMADVQGSGAGPLTRRVVMTGADKSSKADFRCVTC